MPTYLATDPETGLKIRLTGDAPPSEADISSAFASVKASQPKTTQPAPEQPSGLGTIMPALSQVGLGVAKGVGSTVTGLGEIASKLGVPAVGHSEVSNADAEAFKMAHEATTAEGPAQMVGKAGEQLGEFALAGSAKAPLLVSDALKASKLARIAAGAFQGGAVSGAQSGGDKVTATLGAAGGAGLVAAPMLASPAGKAALAVAKMIPGVGPAAKMAEPVVAAIERLALKAKLGFALTREAPEAVAAVEASLPAGATTSGSVPARVVPIRPGMVSQGAPVAPQAPPPMASGSGLPSQMPIIPPRALTQLPARSGSIIRPIPPAALQAGPNASMGGVGAPAQQDVESLLRASLKTAGPEKAAQATVAANAPQAPQHQLAEELQSKVVEWRTKLGYSPGQMVEAMREHYGIKPSAGKKMVDMILKTYGLGE